MATQTLIRKRAQVNREAWLTAIVRAFRPIFKAAGYELPDVRVSVGWPGGKRSTKNAVGQCWAAQSATDNRAQIFVSPVISDGRRAIDILVHELCHAVDRNVHGHTGEFVKIASAVGLEGKPTETHAGPDLAERASGLVKRLGKYPHAELSKEMTTGTKKQTTRQIKCVCQCEPPRIVRMPKSGIEAGPILCGLCEQDFAPEVTEP